MQDDPNSAAGVREGDILAGKYRVERVLGIGGMGVVVAAHHIHLDEKVALKFLLPEALGNYEAVARFAREARAAVKIKSEHVARVIDVGHLENGAPYMVMEYLEGTDLAAWLEERGVMLPEQAVEFVLQACEAIAEAHVLGIVHRDLKPANLFCIRRADGRLSVKVLDFGISKITAKQGGTRRDVSTTRANALVGSPLYMSPEQMQTSKRVDARTDIWSLGIILFELLSGRVPFEGEVVTDLAIKIAMAVPLSLRDLRPEVPVGLERVVLRCLEKEPRRRFQNVGDLATALGNFGPKRAKVSVERILGVMQAALASGEPPSRSSEIGRTRAPVGPTGTVASWGKTGGWTSKRNVLLGVSVVAGLVAAVACIALFTRKGSDAQSLASTATRPPVTTPLAPPQPPSVSSAWVTLSDSSIPPTIALTDLPIAPPPLPPPPSHRPTSPLAPARPLAGTPDPAAPPSHPVSSAPSTKGGYDPLDHWEPASR
jgi:serine/threonine-protein kinase